MKSVLPAIVPAGMHPEFGNYLRAELKRMDKLLIEELERPGTWFHVPSTKPRNTSAAEDAGLSFIAVSNEFECGLGTADGDVANCNEKVLGNISGGEGRSLLPKRAHGEDAHLFYHQDRHAAFTPEVGRNTLEGGTPSITFSYGDQLQQEDIFLIHEEAIDLIVAGITDACERSNVHPFFGASNDPSIMEDEIGEEFITLRDVNDRYPLLHKNMQVYHGGKWMLPLRRPDDSLRKIPVTSVNCLRTGNAVQDHSSHTIESAPIMNNLGNITSGLCCAYEVSGAPAFGEDHGQEPRIPIWVYGVGGPLREGTCLPDGHLVTNSEPFWDADPRVAMLASFRRMVETRPILIDLPGAGGGGTNFQNLQKLTGQSWCMEPRRCLFQARGKGLYNRERRHRGAKPVREGVAEFWYEICLEAGLFLKYGEALWYEMFTQEQCNENRWNGSRFGLDAKIWFNHKQIPARELKHQLDELALAGHEAWGFSDAVRKRYQECMESRGVRTGASIVNKWFYQLQEEHPTESSKQIGQWLKLAIIRNQTKVYSKWPESLSEKDIKNFD